MTIEDKLDVIMDVSKQTNVLLDSICNQLHQLNNAISNLPDKIMGKYVQMQLTAAQTQTELTKIPTYKPPTIGQYPKLEK